MISQASRMLGDVDLSTLQPFDEIDPYNNIQVSGFLCSQSDERYGALVIQSVDGKKVRQQVIYCTPKLHYPFTTNRNTGKRTFFFPKISLVKVYDKLDGTNICCFSYADYDGKRYVSFKTRLTPFLRQSKFGDFKSMWDEMLVKYPNLRCPEQVSHGNFSFSYELFGYRNPHLIIYKEPLDTKLLFVVRQSDAKVFPNNMFGDGYQSLPEVETITNTEDLVSFYNAKREEALKKNKKLEDGTIDGTEGYVMYCLTAEGDWIQYKIKPEDVESIHFATGSIPYNVVLATAWNSLESVEGDLTEEYVKKLLLEEFEAHQVEKSVIRISQAVEQVKEQVIFRSKVKEAYDCSGLTYEKDGKRILMWAMSTKFARNQMAGVYNALKALNLIKE